MAYEKALSLISGGGGFTPAELVIDGNKYTVKATPETIESVFVASGNGGVIYRVYSATGNDGPYALFHLLDEQNMAVKQFVYDETAGGYVWSGGLG